MMLRFPAATKCNAPVLNDGMVDPGGGAPRPCSDLLPESAWPHAKGPSGPVGETWWSGGKGEHGCAVSRTITTWIVSNGMVIVSCSMVSPRGCWVVVTTRQLPTGILPPNQTAAGRFWQLLVARAICVNIVVFCLPFITLQLPLPK
jgi:hypothetical protein